MYQKSYKEKDILIVHRLIKEEGHIRELSRETNLKPMTVKRELEKLVEGNVVDFKTEGRNKIFFLKNSYEATNMKKIVELKKREEIVKKHLILRKIFWEIEKNRKISLAVLFGSYAKGLENKGSDIDIYIETKNPNIKKEIEKINSNISVKIGDFDKKKLLIKEIIKENIVIKGIDKYYEKEA